MSKKKSQFNYSERIDPKVIPPLVKRELDNSLAAASTNTSVTASEIPHREVVVQMNPHLKYVYDPVRKEWWKICTKSMV